MTNQKHIANVYDFDHTIYNGDASLDFIIFCLLRNPRTWRYLPTLGMALLSYVLGYVDRKVLKEQAFKLLASIENLDEQLELFWQKNERKIKAWYTRQKKESDIIISASPEFLLRPITTRLSVDTLIATKMDPSTGKISGQNCRGKEKVNRLRTHNNRLQVDACYSDSLSDRFILALAQKPFIVRRDIILPLSDYKPSKLRHFKKASFLRFLIVGGLNAVLGVLFAYAIAVFMYDHLLAWVLGYLLSLVFSYPLNAVITFRRVKLNWRQFGSFVVSYIPNFVVQFISVYLLIGYFKIFHLFAYILAVAVAVPITFFLLDTKTFRKMDT